MTRYLMALLIVLCACWSNRPVSKDMDRVSEFPGSEQTDPVQDEGTRPGEPFADIAEEAQIEYGGPVIPPEGPSEIFVRYIQFGMYDTGEVVCTLVPAGRDWRADRCRACSFWHDQILYEYMNECFDPDCPPEQVQWDRSGEIIPKPVVDNVFEAMHNLPKVETMRKCYFANDSMDWYHANIQFPDSAGCPPIQVRRGDGDCAPHYVIQGDDRWCNCSSLGLGAIVKYLGGVGTMSYLGGTEGMEYCSCFEDFCYGGPCG